MSKVREFHTPIQRKRPLAAEWEFRDLIGQYEIEATEYLFGGNAAWLVKVGEKTYWAENGNVSPAKVEGPRFEKFGDSIDVNLQGCICEALGRFEKLAPDRESAKPI
jgi:hypothetical protein